MYRKLIPYLKPYWGKIVGSSVCSVVEAIFELTIPLLLAAMLDQGIGTGNISLTLKLGGLMLLWYRMDVYERSRPGIAMETLLAAADETYWRGLLTGLGMEE